MQPDPFTSFNARAVPGPIVARNFVPPIQFETLTHLAHTIVVGPRGSGKTTLLKMLTPEALTDREAQAALADLPPVEFTGVFVPTDISWKNQLDALRRLNLSTQESEGLVRDSFTTAVLRSFITAIHQRVSAPAVSPLLRLSHLSMDPDDQAMLAQDLAGLWRLELRVPSLLGLRAALSERLTRIARFALAEDRHSEAGRKERFEANRDLDAPLIPSLSAALDVLEARKPQVVGERWALLFDELELAPSIIRTELLQALRSVDERFLFKLSLSPFSNEFSELANVLSAMPGHDHEEVSLSYGRKEDGIQFSLDLMQAVVRRREHEPTDLQKLFGPADFPVQEDWAGGKEPIRVLRAFRRLYEDDQTFRQYADAHGGSLDGYLALEGTDRAQFVRKVAPIVIVRAAFRIPDSSRARGSRRFKTRKNPDIYRGHTSLATLLEGNPRYIIGVLNGLLSGAPQGTIGGPRQAVEVAKTANRFRALLTTIPSPVGATGNRRALLSLVDTMGTKFRQATVGANFTPDPIGSVIVDSNTPTAMLDALGDLVNAGALVYVPDPEGGAIMTSLKGKRLRLNYLLASQYGLPLRLERAVNLSSLLGSRSGALADSGQPTLFERPSH